MAIRIERVVRPALDVNIHPPRRSIVAEPVKATGQMSATFNGVPVDGDQVSVIISSTALVGSPITINFDVVGGGATTIQIVAGLVAAINAHAELAAKGISASASRPNELSISQPASLNPQATFTISVTGVITVAIAGDVISISPGKEGATKTFTTSTDVSITLYNKKWPKETTLADVLAGNVPAP